MMRSLEPGSGSSMVISAPDSIRTLRIRFPPLPIIAPANCATSLHRLVLHDQDAHHPSHIDPYTPHTHVFRDRHLSRRSISWTRSIAHTHVTWGRRHVVIVADIVVSAAKTATTAGRSGAETDKNQHLPAAVEHEHKAHGTAITYPPIGPPRGGGPPPKRPPPAGPRPPGPPRIPPP